MASLAVQVQPADLAKHEGRGLFNAAEAMLKGILEADREVSLVTGPANSFANFFETATRDGVLELLGKHGTSVLATASARRGLKIALRRARGGDRVLAMVPNSELHTALGELAEVSALSFAAASGKGSQAPGVAAERSSESGALCVILGDDPSVPSHMCPRQVARHLGLACIEPATIGQLRDAMDQALRLSRAGACAVAIIVHQLLLRSCATIEVRPNRVAGSVDVMLLRRKRRQRITESGGLLRMARRMELNRIRALPSPGERVAVGFITVGPTDAALMHLTHTLRLRGRVPVMQLGLLDPLDEVLLERFLARCQQVVVLEPRPGSVQSAVLATAERIRQQGHTPAGIWGQLIPPGEDGMTMEMGINEAVHVSTLARRVIHLLHPLRPGLQIGERLAPPPPYLPKRPLPRGKGIGAQAAYAAVRRILADADQRLRDEGVGQEQSVTTALTINGASAPSSVDRVVPVELWHGVEFRELGASVLDQVAGADLPFVMLVIDVDSERGELQRLVRAYIPTEFAERVKIITGDLNEPIKLRDRLVSAALLDQVSIVLVSDGEPPRYSLERVERALSETDQLGFEPRQWIIRPAEEVCAIRDQFENEGALDPRDVDGTVGDVRRLLGSRPGPVTEDDASHTALPAGSLQLDSIMRTRYVVEKLSKRQSSRMRMKVRPLLEQIEVVRTRPPAWVWRRGRHDRLELPVPIHARQGVWCIHIAGWRGQAPGIAAQVLAQAGRNMGYDVAAAHDRTFIGAGRRAWAQLVFTRGSSDPDVIQPPLIPYGEADVLLGMDWQEALRSVDSCDKLQVVHRDRTCALVNVGTFQADARRAPTSGEQAELIRALRAVSRDDHCLAHDYAAACRTWLYTDRVTDLAMLGSAFQLGLIPVRLDAIESALKGLEAGGYARSLEAFEFGRTLVVDDRLLPSSRKHRSEVTEDLNRITRRLVLSVRRSRWGGKATARGFKRLLQQCILATPGLAETAAGRQAQRDMVAALYRCLEWGGMKYATRYGQLLMALYRADRGEKGRAITRDAVLPLAEAMLVRDQVYIACMAASPEQRRRLQAASTAHGGGLNVKRARGDRIERRYLTRIELIAFKRRFRLDLRTSDWLARVAKASRAALPHAWRGSRRDRELRNFMINFVQRATHECDQNYEAWAEAMHRLHHHAAEQRLRHMAISEVRMLTDGVKHRLIV